MSETTLAPPPAIVSPPFWPLPEVSNDDLKQPRGLHGTNNNSSKSSSGTAPNSNNNYNNKNNNCKSHSHDGGGSGAKSSKCQPSWRAAMEKFAYNTTLHGMRHLTSDVGIVRRILWLVLFFLCAVVMSIQIIERIVYFYQFPTTVNVKVNFNKTLSFPALTICNQNAFRASSADRNNVYQLIEKMYSHDYNVTQKELASSLSASLTLDGLYKMAAHRKEDLIVGCQWQDVPCGPENFTDILTDHGVCYNFNHKPSRPLVVSSAGSKYGLRLTLNVEQYEYMPGPHDAAGVKILLHDHKEFPKVADLGLAIPTGTHAFVGMQLVRIDNLAEPYGTCKSESSPFYESYSTDACHLSCFTEHMAAKCGCRDMFMPHVNGSPPICTLKEYVGCYKENIVHVKTLVQDTCKCPIPCHFRIYDPTVSFASTSVYATERLLATTATDALHRKYIKARETTARMDKLKFDIVKRLLSSTKKRFEHLKTIMADLVHTHLETQKEALQVIHDQMQSVWQKKKYLLDWQAYHVEKNFMRARQAMEERTLFYLVLGYQEFSYQIEIRIHQMAQVSDNDTLAYENVKTDLYLQTMNMLSGRIDLSDRALANYTQLYNAYLNGTAIFRYKFYEEPRNDNQYITPRPLLRESLFRTAYTLKYSSRVGKDIKNIRHWLGEYSKLANKSYENGTVEWKEVHKANVMFMNRCRRFYHSKSTFYAESIEHPLRVLRVKIADFERAWRNFEGGFQNLAENVQNILNRMTDLENTILHRINDVIYSMDRYVLGENITKTEVADELTSDALHAGIGTLKNFFHELRSRGQDLYDGWPVLLKLTNEIWRTVVEDENMQEYYQYKNMTTGLRDYNTVSSENERSFAENRDRFDFRFQIGHLDNLFLIEMEKMMAHMAEFKQRNRLDSRFINENFLQVDVFYREKSYEHIAQQSAYDIFALLCDVGGSMGLFVGASVLTMYELVDFAIQHSLLSASKTSLGAWFKALLGKARTGSSPPIQRVWKAGW